MVRLLTEPRAWSDHRGGNADGRDARRTDERPVGLRQAQIGNRPAAREPLLMLCLQGRFAASGSTAITYDEAEAPVSRLINEFGPTVVSPQTARQRAAMPFVHPERKLWDPRDQDSLECSRAWQPAGSLRCPRPTPPTRCTSMANGLGERVEPLADLQVGADRPSEPCREVARQVNVDW